MTTTRPSRDEIDHAPVGHPTYLSADSPKFYRRHFTLEQVTEADEHNVGFCVACGAGRDCCEPDARRYHCDECGRDQVYGAAEIALMGWVR